MLAQSVDERNGAEIDLAAYFSRIGFTGEARADFETLYALQYAHATSIPFENLHILFGHGIKLDPETLQRKILRECRGGYCFEQNGLFLRVLKQIGFAAEGLIGRVRWMTPEDQPTPLTHMLIRVELEDGPYLVDGGFGGLRQTVPLKLVPGLVQKTTHEDMRLVEKEDGLLLEADLGERWAGLCQFALKGVPQTDYELGSWYTSTHPDSLFVNNLIVEMPGEGVRRTIFNGEFIERRLGEEPRVTKLETADQAAAVLAEYFGLSVTDPAEKAVLQRFIEKPRMF